MQNKGIVICVAVLLTLASIFYLSFSFATRYYDSEAAKIKDPIAQQDYKDSVSDHYPIICKLKMRPKKQK